MRVRWEVGQEQALKTRIDVNYYLGTLEGAELAKIADATRRLIESVSSTKNVRAELCAERATSNPHVQRLHIILYFVPGTITCPRCEIVWVDDYELAFLIMDDI